ncbi:hypothetical protein WJX73_001717 [Symbiochloris irregularis]|uniref:Ribosomal protein n=1 Tax=Symbiochloris irregularis TaxID=706552 RepID=A0AAW1PDP3_9CHLO
MLARALRTGGRALCSRFVATEAVPLQCASVSQGTEAAQLRSDWPRLEVPSVPLPRFIDPHSPSKRQKREPVALAEAVAAVKANATANFNETVDVCIALGTNPKRGDQMVRGATTLPHGTGKEPRICVFAKEADAADARAAGADVIGDETYIDTILREGSSALNFDACLGTRAMMPKLTKIARVLGPRGLMPNPKTGTLIEPGGMRVAIDNMKKGRVQYRADRFAVVHAGIGKAIIYGASQHKTSWNQSAAKVVINSIA